MKYFFITYYQCCRFCICNICCRWQGSSCLSANWIRVKLWSSKHENNLRAITDGNFSRNCVCLPAVRWMTAVGWKTCSFIYSEAVNLFPLRERQTRQDASHSVTRPSFLVQWMSPCWLFDLSSVLQCSVSSSSPPSLPRGAALGDWWHESPMGVNKAPTTKAWYWLQCQNSVTGNTFTLQGEVQDWQ